MGMQKWSRWDKRFLAGLAAAVLIFGVCMAMFLQMLSSFLSRAGEEEAETLRKAISRASVQCYAIEGRYPPSIEYLEDHYGIRIDRKRYHVFYSGFASNIMPEITVVPAGGGPNDKQ